MREKNVRGHASSEGSVDWYSNHVLHHMTFKITYLAFLLFHLVGHLIDAECAAVREHAHLDFENLG